MARGGGAFANDGKKKKQENAQRKEAGGGLPEMLREERGRDEGCPPA